MFGILSIYFIIILYAMMTFLLFKVIIIAKLMIFKEHLMENSISSKFTKKKTGFVETVENKNICNAFQAFL